MKITIVKRYNDYMAYLDGDRRMWGAGKNHYEAVGSAIMAHVLRLGIAVTVEED